MAELVHARGGERVADHREAGAGPLGLAGPCAAHVAQPAPTALAEGARHEVLYVREALWVEPSELLLDLVVGNAHRVRPGAAPPGNLNTHRVL